MGGDLDAERIQVEAIGEPGDRRFRLLSIVNGQTYAVWMEKQQVQALGLALEQMLARLPDAGPVLPATPGLAEFDRRRGSSSASAAWSWAMTTTRTASSSSPTISTAEEEATRRSPAA